MTVFILALLFVYLISPLIINYIVYKSSFLRRVGAIVIAYLIGLIIGNAGLFPEASKSMVELINDKDIILTGKLINELYPGENFDSTKTIKVNKELVEDLYLHGTLTEDDVTYFAINADVFDILKAQQGKTYIAQPVLIDDVKTELAEVEGMTDTLLVVYVNQLSKLIEPVQQKPLPIESIDLLMANKKGSPKWASF